MSSPSTLLVFSNLPDRASAETLAAALVQRQAAACVNIMAPCRSVYRWQGAVEQSEEIPVFIKTTADRYELVEHIVRELHPYELPEIIALPVTGGLPAYLAWVAAETRPDN
ncbi:MAG TPA: divalent-cation tolerance protein CutA [Burkholderiales bacterium]|nr:divalent-cation tolerance protein CutA [Burkholderiales bacterium]